MNSDLLSDFAENDDELDEESTNIIKANLIKKTEKISTKDQLLMFVTGPAGTGKSTSIKFAQQFCFEFWRSIDIIWGENTFLITATTGYAAALFGGVTFHSAAFLNSKSKNIADEMMRI